MISDSTPNASVAVTSSNLKDFAKKKRTNRSAKLNQCKLDARREQWLSQVKNKGEGKEGMYMKNKGDDRFPVKCEGGTRLGLVDLEKKNMPVEKLEMSPRGEEGMFLDGLSIHHFSDSELSPLNSPTYSALGSNDSGVNFTSSSRSSSSSGRSSSYDTNGFFSGILTEEDEGNVGEDGCLDDWEAITDALAATEDKQKEHNPSSGYIHEDKRGYSVPCCSNLSLADHPLCENNNPKGKQEDGGTSMQIPRAKCQAWRPDDAFWPQSLPNLSKQCSFQLNSEWHLGEGGSVWGCKNIRPVPPSCPICFEDLDFTDSSFVPCFCGFRLCLFCHKRILEEDGRCPGCRKQYDRLHVEGEVTFDDGILTLQLTPSCSMTTRS